jgi:hypothetical protein
MSFGAIFLTIMGLLIAIPIVGAIIWNAHDKHRYKTKGSNQKLMFNELSRGDYMWSVTNQGIDYVKIDKIRYFFDGDHRNIVRFRIYWGEWDYIDIPAHEAKTFKHGKWHTIKQAAELEFKRIETARDEGISSFKGATPEDIKNAQKKLLEQLDKIK